MITIGAYTIGGIDDFKNLKEAKDFILERYPTLDEVLVESKLKPLFRNESKSNQSDDPISKGATSNKANAKAGRGGNAE